MADKEERVMRQFTEREKRDFRFRMIDGKALAGLERDLKKAKLERDPGECFGKGGKRNDKPRVLED